MSRRKNVAPDAERRSGRLRLAAVVYAVVVILGLVGTGAHALWSQSGTVGTSVTTGSWAPKQVGGVVTCSARAGLLATTSTLDIEFDFPTDADAVKVAVIDGTGNVRTQTVSAGGTSGRAAAAIPVANGVFKWNNKDFPVTLTSSYKGTSDEPVRRTVTWTYRPWTADYSASC